MSEARNGANSRSGEINVPWNLVIPEADIYLVGYGMRLPNDFTLEMLAVLKRCRRVFGGPPIHAPDFGIPQMENLLVYYGTDKNRHKTYAEMLDVILDAAGSTPPVAFATYGSAMVGTLVAHRILAEAPRRGLSVHVTNAVSCFDGMWADFNLDPFYGFEIWEATALVRMDVKPDTTAHLVLPQAPMYEVTTGVDLATLTMQTSSAVAVLRDHLLRFYPADHEVHYIKTGSGPGARSLAPDIETLRLADLDHPGRNQGGTLLVPGLARPGALDFPRAEPATTRESVG